MLSFWYRISYNFKTIESNKKIDFWRLHAFYNSKSTNGPAEAFVKKFKMSFSHLYKDTRLNHAKLNSAVKRIAKVLNNRPVSAQRSCSFADDKEILSHHWHQTCSSQVVAKTYLAVFQQMKKIIIFDTLMWLSWSLHGGIN